MPQCFRFTNQETNEPISLQSLDTLICQEAGIKDDPKHWSYLYLSITMAGFAIVAKYGEVTSETFGQYRKGISDAFENEAEWALALKFLVTDYRYDAWYESK